jgi:hypothetical protein
MKRKTQEEEDEKRTEKRIEGQKKRKEIKLKMGR